jgi:hypothetical protein
MARMPAIEVGAYALEPGEAGGTIVQQGEGAAESEVEPLREALAEAGPEDPPARQPDVADEVGEAAEATEKVEKAVALCKGVTEGHGLSPEMLALEVGTLLDCLERLDRKGKHKDSLRMARALATLLLLLKRWAGLLQTLRIARRAGQALGDLDAMAWAEHELGSLRLVAGDVKGADRDLREARRIREEIGDRRGLAATTRNMQVLCDRLRSMLQRDELAPKGSGGKRPPLRYLLAGAAAAAFLFAGGVAAGTIAGGDNKENVAGEGVVTRDGSGNGSGGNRNGSGDKVGPDKTDGDSSTYLLTVIIDGEGDGFVTAGSDCVDSCKEPVPAGETVTLSAGVSEGSEFTGYSGDCEGETCSLTMTSSKTVTATFEPIAEVSGDDTEPGTTTEEEEEEEEEDTSELVE